MTARETLRRAVDVWYLCERTDALSDQGLIIRTTTLRRAQLALGSSPRVSWLSLRIVGTVVLAGLALATLISSLGTVARSPQTHAALVATRTIAAGATITPADVGLADVAIPPLTAAVLPTTTLVLGRQAEVAIPRGTLIERTMLGPPSGNPGRVVTIAVPATAVGSGTIQPSDRVGIVATLTNATGQSTTITLATQLPTLAVTTAGGDVLISVATPSFETALAIVQALAVDKVDVLNATGVAHDHTLASYPPTIAELASHG